MSFSFTTHITVLAVAVFLYWLLVPRTFRPFDVNAGANGKRAIVTGASMGIGREIALELARHNASHIVIVSRSQSRLEKVRNEILATVTGYTGNVHVVPADLNSEQDCADVIARSLDAIGGDGGLDYLILNHITSSRYGTWMSRLNTSEGHSFLQEMFSVNFFSYVYLATHAMTALRVAGGQIGVVSSLAGKIGTPHAAAYGATKHALQGFFGSLRAEMPLDGITNVGVTTIMVGATDTEGAADVKKKLTKVQWDHASLPAKAIVSGLVLRLREVYTPHHLVFPMIYFYNFVPDLLDFVFRTTTKH